ncbi:MAG TPA: carboxyltransferase domain-containing protein, partial [Byssovorax sp.]
MQLVDVTSFGESALLVAVPEGARAADLARSLSRALPGADVVAGARSVLVEGVAAGATRAALERSLDDGAIADEPREHVIAARYDGEDLAAVARATRRSIDEVVRAHAARVYTVEIVGFLPGFAYLGELDPALVLPRLAAPRRIVPARSIAIAGRHTGVYPFASAGGWSLIGRAIDFTPFDASHGGAALRVGDRVRFEPSDAPSVEAPRTADASVVAARGLEVVRAPAGATIQDAGRAGCLGRGLPPSGPLDADSHAAANEAVGNARGTAAIEVPLGALEVRARGRVTVAADGARARTLDDGDRFSIEPEGRAVRYA